jgi:hypothetical protein
VRFPLASDITIASVSVTLQNSAGTPVSINIGYGEAALSGQAPTPGAYAVNGQSVWAADQPISVVPGQVTILPADSPTAKWGAGGELTLRIVTSTGGALGVSVVLFDGVGQVIGTQQAVFWTEVDFPFGPQTATGKGDVQLDFTLVSIGAGNPITNVADRIPLAQTYTIFGLVAVFEQATVGLGSGQDVTCNVVLGDVAQNGIVPSGGAIALPGNMLFASPVVLQSGASSSSNAGITLTFPVSYPAQWPAGTSALTLRVLTPAGGGIGLLKVGLLV